MLTKADFKEIRAIIREEVESEVQKTKDELQAEMKINMMRTITEVRDVKDHVKNIDIQISKIQKDLKYAINFLDKEGLRIQKRVDLIENHLHMPSLS